MEPPEDQAERDGYPGMETEQGIERKGQSQPEAHRDLLRRGVGMEDLVLQLDPETRLLEVRDERQ